jgi:hypothetical protein
MGLVCCLGKLVTKYLAMLRNIAEEQRPELHYDERIKLEVYFSKVLFLRSELSACVDKEKSAQETFHILNTYF